MEGYANTPSTRTQVAIDAQTDGDFLVIRPQKTHGTKSEKSKVF